jgi:DUF971 family protein
MSAEPERIRLDPERSLVEIRFTDGVVHRYDGAWLRHACPCATCRGHTPGEVEGPSWDGVKDVRVRGASPVGNYALRFEFTDGHETGIYSFDWLRAHPQEG